MTITVPSVSMAGYVSAANSSFVALTGDGTFTGVAEINGYPDILISLKTDVAGTLYVDFSTDGGSNFDSTVTYTVAAATNEFHRLIKGTRAYRVRYVNGSSAQAYFRLHVESGFFSQPNKGVQVALTRDDDSASTRPTEFYQEVQEGRRIGYESIAKTGLNTDVTTAEDIWNGGGTYTGQPVNFTPETVTLVSSNDADNGATATGALTVRIEGLRTSTSTDYTTEDITLDGTTPVTSVNTWWRVNRAWVLTAGTGGANAGTITCAPTTTTTAVMFVMPAGKSQTAVAAWTVPAGKTAYIKHLIFTQARASAATGTASVSLRTREAGGVYRARRVYEMTTAYPIDRKFLGGIICLAGTDIKCTVDAVSAASLMGATFEMLVVED